MSAGLICLIPTALSLVVTLWSRGRSASEQLMAVMGGMVFRMGAVLAMSLPLFLSVPQLRESRERELLFWSAVLICYMGTLAGETFLTARSRKTTLNAGHTPAAANGGGAL